MWELCFTFAGSAVVCAFLSALVPAIGAFAYYGVPPDVLARLPPGAGRFHLLIFEEYRSGALDTVDLRQLEGVVTFPSFHAAMALMTAHAVRDMRWLFRLLSVWSGVILISTIPIGGHYAVDLLAGAVVWAAFAFSRQNPSYKLQAAPSSLP
jgi:membrane-associated phospholipid phosphatase